MYHLYQIGRDHTWDWHTLPIWQLLYKIMYNKVPTVYITNALYICTRICSVWQVRYGIQGIYIYFALLLMRDSARTRMRSKSTT